MNIETIPDIEVIEHLDFDAELGCEGTTHSSGYYGHVPAQSASWVVTTPCCGLRILECDGWVADRSIFPVAVCRCGASIYSADIHIERLRQDV